MIGLQMLQQLVGGISILVSGVGAIWCGLYLARSRWVWLLAGGFAIEAITGVLYRVVGLMTGYGGLGSSGVGALFLVFSLLGLGGRAATVAGAVGLLSERAGAK